MNGEALFLGAVVWVCCRIAIRCMGRKMDRQQDGKNWLKAPERHETVDAYYERMDSLAEKEGHENDR